MADRINVQVIFKKFWWTCPKCKQEDTVDANVGGGNTYEHTCSTCSEKFNQSGTNMREYNGCLTYSKDDYEKKQEKDITDEKTAKFSGWVTEVKNPPAYVEPTIEELEKMLAEKQEEVDRIQQEINAKEINVGK